MKTNKHIYILVMLLIAGISESNNGNQDGRPKYPGQRNNYR